MQLIHKHFPIIPSTNDWLKEHAATFPLDALLCVSADLQTAGRGQYGRKWVSIYPGNIYASFGFYLSKQEDAFGCTHLLAATVTSLLEGEGVEGSIKWPNDVLVKGKKMAGILCETQPLALGARVILGIGLNVHMSSLELETIDQPATSLWNETKKSYSLTVLLSDLQREFRKQLLEYIQKIERHQISN